MKTRYCTLIGFKALSGGRLGDITYTFWKHDQWSLRYVFSLFWEGGVWFVDQWTNGKSTFSFVAARCLLSGGENKKTFLVKMVVPAKVVCFAHQRL